MSYAWVPTTACEDLAKLANGDPYIQSVGLYVWTCRHKRATGIYPLPVEYAMTDLKYPREQIARALQALHEQLWIRWDERAGWVFVREYAAHNLKGNGPGGTFHRNDNRLRAVRDQLAEAQQRAPTLVAEWYVVYDHLLPYEPEAQRRIAGIGSRIQSHRGDQTVRRGPPLPLEGDPPSPSKGTPGPPVGIPEDPPQSTGTTGTTEGTAADAAHHPVDPVENRPDGSQIESVGSVVYQPAPNEHAPSWHARERELGLRDEGDPPSPSEQAGLPLPLAPVVVERVYRRGRSTYELAREPAADGNRSILRTLAYAAFDMRYPDGYPEAGLSWEALGDIVEDVKERAARMRIAYEGVRDAVDHVCLMRQKGVGAPKPSG